MPELSYPQSSGVSGKGRNLGLVVFLAVGFAISLLHEKLHRMRGGLIRTARQNHSGGGAVVRAHCMNSVSCVGSVMFRFPMSLTVPMNGLDGVVADLFSALSGPKPNRRPRMQ